MSAGSQSLAPPQAGACDHIKINKIQLAVKLHEPAWPVDLKEEGVLQPVSVSLDFTLDLNAAGLSDTLEYSVDYSRICGLVQEICSDSKRISSSGVKAYDLAYEILEKCIAEAHCNIKSLAIELELPKATLLSEICGVRISRNCDDKESQDEVFFIKKLPLTAIVGILPHERNVRQPLVLDLFFAKAQSIERSGLKRTADFRNVERLATEFVQKSSFYTLEALAASVANECLEYLGDNPWKATVTVRKPAALTMAAEPEVVLSRSRSYIQSNPYQTYKVSNLAVSASTSVALALGSNTGDRFKNIELALRYLEYPEPILDENRANLENANGVLRVVETSFMYETAPMYVLDQPSFINCACLLETTFSSLDMLRIAKAIEQRVGRQKSERFGPRAVDVDLISFGSEVIDSRPQNERDTLDNLEGELVVPHPRLREREFVLRPLNDIIPRWVHPQTGLTIESMLRMLTDQRHAQESPVLKVIPFPDTLTAKNAASPYDVPSILTYWILQNPLARSCSSAGKRAYIMATLNVTPDSFSDGGVHSSIDAALEYVEDAVSNGADIIDIGGYSTRPGAAFVSTEEEIGRVLPIIQAIRTRSAESVKNVLISIDTFRWQVAKAAIAAGANVINDVHAFSGPQYPLTTETEKEYSHMKQVAREANVPVIMMHSRGDAGSNKSYPIIAASKGKQEIPPVLEGIEEELGTKVSKAVRGANCLRRWQIIVDPGLGFSKTEIDNLAILRHAHRIVDENRQSNALAGYPLLIGASRKSFLGSIVSRSGEKDAKGTRPAAERDFATAAAVASAIQQKVDILRVHNVRGMVDTVKVLEAIWN